MASSSSSSPPLLTAPSCCSKPNRTTSLLPANSSTISTACRPITGRRELIAAGVLAFSTPVLLIPAAPSFAAEDEEYVRETEEVINKLRSTIGMDKADPNVASAVMELRDASNYWVAKYRREKSLLGRASFRDVYAALNAVSGHYISFGPTAPIPAKRRARILEEVETAEKALSRGR